MVPVGPGACSGPRFGGVTHLLRKAHTMTATQQQPQEAPQVPTTPPQRRRSRTLPVVIGAALAAVGSVVALAGGGVLVAAGSDGTIGSGGSHQVSTPTQAVVTSAATIDD